MQMRRLTSGTVALVVTILPVAGSGEAYRDTAFKAAVWLERSAVMDHDNLVWRADPDDPRTVTTSLYSGTPGPILFMLELGRASNASAYVTTARRAADALIGSIPTERQYGLYEGLAGTGFTLGEVYLLTHEDKYRIAALDCVRRLHDAAKPVGRGVQWNDTTDIIAGGSGIGLFLLWADEELHAPGALDLATRSGLRLIELGLQPAPGQRAWMMSPAYPKELPNFAHGTAGVAYFLATLYRSTKRQEFLDAALEGGRYLIAIADKDGDICLIRHNDGPSDRHLYYLSWCHGPAGTARLFYRLFQTTNDRAWMTWTEKAARAVIASGGPGRVVTPGEWDNLGMCCGVTGQAQFFLNMFEVTHDREYMTLARAASDMLVARATHSESGARWVQAETRVRPEVRIAQTGLMQGASGIGLWLLHFAQFVDNKRAPVITLPDNPFKY
jgi:lantibiotic modifying enzyme